MPSLALKCLPTIPTLSHSCPSHQRFQLVQNAAAWALVWSRKNFIHYTSALETAVATSLVQDSRCWLWPLNPIMRREHVIWRTSPSCSYISHQVQQERHVGVPSAREICQAGPRRKDFSVVSAIWKIILPKLRLAPILLACWKFPKHGFTNKLWGPMI